MNRLLKYSFLSLFLIHTMATFTTDGGREQPLNCEDTEQGSPFLWTLPSREPPVYFFGTIHVPYTMVWGHVPWLAKRSFERADSVFFELDLTDPETVAQLSSCQMLPSGKTLADILPANMYKRLKGHLDYVKLMIPSWMQDEHRGLYSEYLFKAITGNWEKKRPVWVMLMINSLTESDIRSTGIPVLDLWLAREATRLGKRAGAVERVEEQCLPLNGLNGTQVLFALNQTLARLEELRNGRPSPFYGTEDLVRHYNCRNLSYASFANPDVLSDSGDASDELLSKNINQYFRQELIEKRNARMAHRVLQLLQQYPDESFFFAFGTGHFLGNGSVLDYVREGGYEVEQVSPDAKIRNFRKPHHHPRHRGSHQPFVPGAAQPWENRDRRRYRKRGHHHHHGVQLLRTVSTPAPSRGRQHQPRQFNDLWVKLDNQDKSSVKNFDSMSDGILKNSRKKLPAWHGNNSRNKANMLVLDKLIWFICLACVSSQRYLHRLRVTA
ncbi:unnamed protein product [Larinioides sclopetarius]|uniref:Metalloprotease TIKI homolog n=1 Tax=Larinioides sclopetarius TaxID=280406 RepID=A0AAV2AAK1_9ARAC